MDKEKNLNTKKCEICKSEGLYICFDCNSYFCDEFLNMFIIKKYIQLIIKRI